MKIEKSLVSGSMMLLILRLLEEKDMYGYEMIEALREKSQNESITDLRQQDMDVWRKKRKSGRHIRKR